MNSIPLKHKATLFLSPEEIKTLRQRSDFKGWRAVLMTWMSIVLIFAGVAVWPNPFTLLMALILIAGQQLSLVILMHEAAHRTLFKTTALNDWAGQWLCAYPVLQDTAKYRKYHLEHHKTTGTAQDPDLPLKTSYPTTKLSFLRKITRDLTGIVGVKTLFGLLAMHGDFIQYELGGRVIPIQQTRGLKQIIVTLFTNIKEMLLLQSIFLTLLWITGYLWLYGLWWLAFLTTYQLILRIRSIGEHGMTPDPYDSLLNARTTYATWWQRFLIAPHNVNYHLEHHMLVSVPWFNLPKMHQLLKAKGVFDTHPACVAQNYSEVLKAAIV